MAAVTPTSIKHVSLGSLGAVFAEFADTTDDADTWVSGIDDIAIVIPIQNGAVTTQASAGVGASHSGGTVTFHIGEDNTPVNLLVLRGSLN